MHANGLSKALARSQTNNQPTSGSQIVEGQVSNCVLSGRNRRGNERLQMVFAESQAATIKHTVITREKTIGMTKRYFQLTTVMAAKQRAKAHAVTRMPAKVCAGRPPRLKREYVHK